MPVSALRYSAATLGAGALAFALAAPAFAQSYGDQHHRQMRYRHYAHHERYQHYRTAHHIVVHPRAAYQPVQPYQGYAWGPAAAVGAVVGGVGDAARGVLYGAGAVVGGVLGGVFGGVNALFGYPYAYNPAPAYVYGAPGYAYGGPIGATFAAPFNAAGDLVAAPFHAVGGAFGAPQYVASGATYAPATGAPAYSYESRVGPQPGWIGHCDLIAGNRVCSP